MRKSVLMLAAVVVLGVGLVPAAGAFTLSVVPQASTVNVGGTVAVDVVASDLVGSAETLGAYDVSLFFDPAVLSFESIVFGTGLSVTGVPPLIRDYESGVGFVNPYEASFEDTADLEALQPDAFTLFTATFNAIQIGGSALTLQANSLGDAPATGELAAVMNGGAVSVVGAPVVPLPAGVWLLLSGLGGVGVVGRGRRRGWFRGC